MFLGIIIVLLIGIAWYGFSPLFMNKKVNDALPSPADGTETEGEISARVPIKPTTAHPASGFVRIIKTTKGHIVRYEEYKTINGPDVRVYLAKDLDAKEYIDLGPIKGTEGNINYPIPKGINISDYDYILTWCEDFSILFNSANITSIR